MKLRHGALAAGASAIIAAGALVLPVVVLPSAAGGVTGTAQTFTLTPTGTTLMKVGTSTWAPTEAAGPTGAQGPPGTRHATPAASAAAQSRVPDAGITDRSATVAAAPGSPHGQAHRHGTPGSPPAGPPQHVGGPTAGLVSAAGIDGYNQGVLHPVYKTGVPQPLPGVDVEPPDQGLCAGNGVVMEVNNMVVQMFTAATMKPFSKNGMALEKLFDAPEVFGATGGTSYSVQGDPRCEYDPSSNRWFASQIWLTEVDGTSAFGWAGEFVAVSATSSPLGSWTVYFIPDQFNKKAVDSCNNTAPATNKSLTTFTLGSANPCFGDQPLLGMNGNAVFISVNEYSLYTATGPGGVATEYVLSKTDLLAGTASPIYWGHLGDTLTRPGAGACPFGTPTAVHCPYYSITPAVSDGAYVSSTTGTFYGLSNVTFTTSGGHQAAVWKFTHTDAVTSGGTHVTGSMTVVTTAAYTEPPLATQKEGPHPLGTLWRTLTGAAPIKWPSGEGKVATNTDRVATAAYDPADGSLWAALNTATQSRGPSEAGIMWVRLVPSGSGPALTASDVSSGYVSAPAVNAFFPGISFTNSGRGVMDYALMGPGYYPSTGYSLLSAHGTTGTLHVARLGAGPQDGFSEYTATYDRPRWGDYSTALATGTTFYFAGEMVNQSCTVSQFEATFTCGGTRDIEANFGTSVNKLPAGH